MFVKVFFVFTILPFSAIAETGYNAWLRYPPIAEHFITQYNNLPEVVVTINPTLVIETAQQELIRGLNGFFGIKVKTSNSLFDERAFILSTIDSIRPFIPEKDLPKNLKSEGFHIQSYDINEVSFIVVIGSNDVGVLYGTFELLKKIGLHQTIDNLNESHNPYANIRYANEWDNLDGSIERGYAGRSIFFDKNNILTNLSRVNDYARLLASIGINSCTVNNVNANIRVIKTEFLPQLKRLAEVFRNWGIRISISIDFASPRDVGGLTTFDPLDKEVIKWWAQKTDEIYDYVPDLAGYVLKADAEGRPGPSKYNRTAADAANVVARALKPHNGVILYRGFVYGYPLNWKNLTIDRANAAFDTFAKLNGKFDDNAIVQIKYGPIDFQVREGISSLFGALNKTNVVIEFEVTQEYTGQQRHVVFLPHMWKEVLHFDMKINNRSTLIKSIVSGKLFNRSFGGFAGVVNVGLSKNWMGNDLSMANVYAFGRLAWNPDLSLDEIIEDWIRLTFNDDKKVIETIKNIQLNSYLAFENYTGPLGAGSLTDITGSKYGPGIESSEHNGWGQWHRADHYGIGMDRTVATGTKYIGQYPPLIANIYESVDTCPDKVLLFMHHVVYNHVLHSGKTVIQHIYDTHYSGAETVKQFHKSWSQLKGKIDEQRFEFIKSKLSYQSGHAIVWRDAICQWFSKISAINDTKGRVGHYKGRIEAEAMQLKGYEITGITPWETASNGKAITCKVGNSCSAETVFRGDSGVYDISIQFYDENDGISHYKTFISSKLISEWKADDILPSDKPNGDTNTRHNILNVNLKNNDIITIEGMPDNGEHAIIDYIEITLYESD